MDLSSVDDAAQALRDAAEGTVDVTLDPLWGDPMVAALEASSPFARVVQIGQSARAEATVPSSAVRGKPLAILGHTNMAAPQEVKAAAYRRMVEEAAAGRLKVEYETYPLDRVTEMWEAQAAFPRRKLVLLPGS